MKYLAVRHILRVHELRDPSHYLPKKSPPSYAPPPDLHLEKRPES
jgi:hypothetical protein